MSYLCRVKEGNLLTEEGATFIVNASNTRLLLGSAVPTLEGIERTLEKIEIHLSCYAEKNRGTT